MWTDFDSDIYNSANMVVYFDEKASIEMLEVSRFCFVKQMFTILSKIDYNLYLDVYLFTS
jgi:hypothetical protein